MSNNSEDLTTNVQFIETHTGGELNDSNESFINQKKIINDSTTDFIRLINYNNKLSREKDTNDNYINQLNVELNTNPYRLNTLPTTIEGINYSNPIVFPKDYDPYFEYLAQKNLGGLNTKVVTKKTVINIDSANRNINTTVNVNNYLKLENNSIVFTPNTNQFKILINNADKKYVVGDKITLRGYQFYKVRYSGLNIFFNDRESYVILDIPPNFDIQIPYYDIIISISGVNNNGNNYFYNVPLNLINQLQVIEIYNYNSDNRIKFNIPITFYTDNNLNQTLITDCEITYYNIGNYPINLLNSILPISQYYLSPYLLITSVTTKYIQIKLNNAISLNQNILLNGYWIDDNFFTGSNIEIGIINNFDKGYISSSNFKIPLNKTINNVASIKVISSEIPNILKNINAINNFGNVLSTINNLFIPVPNNKLYWDNLLDEETYSISIPTGYYNYVQLQAIINNLMNSTPRINKLNSNLYYLNIFEVILDTSSNISSFKSFNKYILPNCLYSVVQQQDSNGNQYILRISHQQHNLKVGDRIYIFNSISYYYIDATYINDPNGYIITKIINNDYYEIIINNINLIANVGDTKGGYNITINTPNSFRLRFDFSDTFGSIIGFKYVGVSTSITKYSDSTTNYIITNIQSYVYDINKTLVVNDTISQYQIYNDFDNTTSEYLLLQCTNFNNCLNPNGPSYFYKFLMNGAPNTVIYNSYVNSPIYLNPPIRYLSELEFTFIDPIGNQVNFYNRNFSLTLEITNFDNSPENTNINTFTARL
jgi:hypothetical protein